MLKTNFTTENFFNNFIRPKKKRESEFAFRLMKNKLIQILVLLSITIANIPAQENITADKISGCDSLTVQFTLNNTLPLTSYTSVVWNFGDGSSARGTLALAHTYVSPGIYNVRCVLDGGRNILFNDTISVGLTPYADFTFTDTSGSDSEFPYYFESAYFKPIEGIDLNYSWRFPDGTVVNDSVAVYLFPEEEVYPVFLSVTDENGCSDTILKLVPVSRELMVPNVFTPNGDELNDYFEVTTPGDYSYSLRIFTRNGLQVYNSESPLISWDGRITGGREAPEGVYFYIIQSEETPVKTSVSGFLHLFR